LVKNIRDPTYPGIPDGFLEELTLVSKNVRDSNYQELTPVQKY
jgi:hypothetical protein